MTNVQKYLRAKSSGYVKGYDSWLIEQEIEITESEYDEAPGLIAEYNCAIDDMTPGESAAIIDKYYDF